MDTISNMFSQICNGLKVGKQEIITPSSRLKKAILSVMKQEGLIADYKIEKKQGNIESIHVILKYENDIPAINRIRRISKPGLRVYANYDNIPRPMYGLATVILSTSKGLLTGKQARRQKIGGEIICEIY